MKSLFVAPYVNNAPVLPMVDGEPFDYKYLTGKQVERPQRDEIFEDRDVLDEAGEPIGTERVFVGHGDEYMETIDEVAGGIVMVSPSFQGDDDVCVIGVHTDDAKMAVLKSELLWLEDIVEPELEPELDFNLGKTLVASSAAAVEKI